MWFFLMKYIFYMPPETYCKNRKCCHKSIHPFWLRWLKKKKLLMDNVMVKKRRCSHSAGVGKKERGMMVANAWMLILRPTMARPPSFHPAAYLLYPSLSSFCFSFVRFSSPSFSLFLFSRSNVSLPASHSDA